MSSKKDTKKKENPKLSGFFIATWFCVVGAVFFYIPTYMNINNLIIKIILNCLAWVSIAISFIGSMIELSSVLKNEAFSYFGVSLIFFIPCYLLHIFQVDSLKNEVWINIVKIIIILFFIIGSGILLYGVSFLFEKKELETSVEHNKSIIVQDRKNKIKGFCDVLKSVLVAVMPLITAIVQLMGDK
ncbi:hypothetical protein JYG23_04205 [Sedimentibacter sp. zth1]|uniref:hypothetical protein n=1 Tax=Sedimentibacter sp. zth1 TaxID=2816908 RepID=UPI001A9162B0|nr:hypothetical protein [Sedimentibacter sp. zth1]QSX06664.1 hypothetical protein JYG23_04205 [Sedimentibacter sp. zth1]